MFMKMLSRFINYYGLLARPYNYKLTTRQVHHHIEENIVICEEHDGIRRVTLNNDKQRNVLSRKSLIYLKQFLAINGTHTHCIIIGAKGSTFSAGHDLDELTSANKDNHQELFDMCSDVMITIQNLPVPVIAQVQGHAAAAGCQLAASCDIVVAAASAKFSTPGINVGLFCSTPGIAIIRALPTKICAYMLFTGLPITAAEAATFGLVSRMVADDQLEDETMTIARNICNKSLPIQALGKRFLQKQTEMSITEAYREGACVMTENLTLQDTQDGIDAFRNKSKPKWTHTMKKAH